MNSYETLHNLIKKSIKLLIVDFEKWKSDSKALTHKIENELVFNPVLWVKKTDKLSFKEILTNLDSIERIKSVIPIYYIEMLEDNLAEYQIWLDRKNYHEYITKIPIIMVENLNTFEKLYRDLNAWSFQVVGFDLSDFSEIELFEVLNQIQVKTTEKDLIVFLNSDIFKKIPRIKFWNYDFLIFKKPSGDIR